MLIWDLSILTALVWSSSALTSAPLPGTRSKASREWTSTDGIALLRNFFESSDFAAIQAEVAPTWSPSSRESRGSLAAWRKGQRRDAHACNLKWDASARPRRLLVDN